MDTLAITLKVYQTLNPATLLLAVESGDIASVYREHRTNLLQQA